MTIRMTVSEYKNLTFDLDSPGYCLACGERADGCEPDARNYRCESCGAREVFGIEECLIMGTIVFTD